MLQGRGRSGFYESGVGLLVGVSPYGGGGGGIGGAIPIYLKMRFSK